MRAYQSPPESACCRNLKPIAPTTRGHTCQGPITAATRPQAIRRCSCKALVSTYISGAYVLWISFRIRIMSLLVLWRVGNLSASGASCGARSVLLYSPALSLAIPKSISSRQAHSPPTAVAVTHHKKDKVCICLAKHQLPSMIHTLYPSQGTEPCCNLCSRTSHAEGQTYCTAGGGMLVARF